jgi:uncharacterized membrane protein YbaN (DUF454 family)
MQTEAHPFNNLPTKLIACGVIAVCVLLGLAGMVLPVLPGLVFLAVAAVVAAKLSPKFRDLLRRSEFLRPYLDRTDGIAALPLAEQVKLGGLVFLKMLIDGVALLVAGIMKLVKAAERV